jgi:hypothetical protein
MKTILEKYKEYTKLKDKTEKSKEEMLKLINEKLAQAYGKTTQLYGGEKITIEEKTIALDAPYFFAGMKVLEIWETSDQSDYARSYVIPINLLKKGINVKKEMHKMEEDWKKKWTEKAKKAKEKREKAELKRLKRKYRS